MDKITFNKKFTIDVATQPCAYELTEVEREKIIVTTQEEFDNIPKNFCGDIYIRGGDPRTSININRDDFFCFTDIIVEGNSYVYIDGWKCYKCVTANDNAYVKVTGDGFVRANNNVFVVAENNSKVDANDNVVVEAWHNSIVTANNNATVTVYHNAQVSAHDESIVCLYDHATCNACQRAVVTATKCATVFAMGYAKITANGCARVCKRSEKTKIKVSGDAYIIDETSGTRTLQDFMDYHNIKHGKKYATFYKAVHKHGNDYISDYDMSFQYKIGETVTGDCDPNIYMQCSNGLHIASLNWALEYGREWYDLAIIEVKVNMDDIVLPEYSTGKVRTGKLKVIREVPLEECGPTGVVFSKKRELNRLY